MTQEQKLPQDKYYLGVNKSTNDNIWKSRLTKSDENIALHIVQKYGLSDILAQVMVARGINAKDAEYFLEPSLRHLMPDPYVIRDMEKAAQRLCQACLKKEKIAILADYDVDGACSASLLVKFLTSLSVQHRVYIPDRLTEGYGPNKKALNLLADEGASLIITVDCGANSPVVYQAAQDKNIDILVLDHHQSPAIDDNAEVQNIIQVNPNRRDDTSNLDILCAAGVVFMCLVATCRLLRQNNKPNLPDLLSFLDLVALATVCDIVPLRSLNRAFVKKGLLVAQKQNNCGLKALIEAARITAPLNPYHFGFILGPRINAGGRIGDASLGTKLLCCTETKEAEQIAKQLDSLNYSRQAIEKEQLTEAQQQIEREQNHLTEPQKMVFGIGNWHIGIVGLLAARLKERFSLPAFIMTEQETGIITGSARAVPALDIGALIHKAVDLGILEKGGGHSQAAGFSLKPKNILKFKNWLKKQLASQNLTDETTKCLAIDSSISASGATVELIETLEKAGPYGAGHDQPIFALPNHYVSHLQEVGKDGEHLSLILKDSQGKRITAIAFRTRETDLGQFLQSHLRQNIHLAGTLSLNYWNGRVTPQLRIIDAAEVK